jgi:hypothetical protein
MYQYLATLILNRASTNRDKVAEKAPAKVSPIINIPGTDVMILKNLAKKMAFFTQNKAKLCKKIDHKYSRDRCYDFKKF